jgi:flagellar motor switch/type III secretory pathway protein FliN
MAEAALAQTAATPAISAELWEEAGWLPCNLSVEVPLHGFTVRDLLQLSIGSVVETKWKTGEDMPVRANCRQIGWVEFEALGEFLAFRLTELI